MHAGDRYLALRNFALARQWQPEDPDIQRALADILMELGAPQGAAQAIGSPVDLGIRSRQAAEWVRWGAQVENPDPTLPFAGTDAAIAKLQALISEAQSAPTHDQGLLRRLKGDLVVALRDRERWADAVAVADDVQQTGPLPSHVRLAQADALLALQRPEEAQAAYRDVLAADPRNREARQGLFYTQVETEDFAAAFGTADALADEGSPTHRVGISPVPYPDHDWLDAQVLRAQSRRYASMPTHAWQLLHPLADAAPAAPYLRMEQSEIAAARGWPRRAHEEALIAVSLAPNDPTAQLVLADAQFQRRQWLEGEARARRIADIRPDHPQALRMLDNIEAHKDAQLLMYVAPRQADGGGPNASGDGMSASIRVYSPPLAERWRLLVAAEREVDEPEAEEMVRNRYGAGIQGRWPDVTIELVGWSNHGLLGRGGADASLEWQPDDYWSLGAQYQAFSSATPLRAVQAGVWADAAGVSATHAWNEGRVASVALTTLDFSDGNRRWQATADFAATVVDRPGLDVVVRPVLYASRNSLGDAPYFNPERDTSLTMFADIQHLIWRRYQRSLHQRLLAGVGTYWQSGFGNGVVGSLEYSQSYSHDPRTEWNYGVALAREIYDGGAERSVVAFVRLDQKF